jgi:hypothetical protein
MSTNDKVNTTLAVQELTLLTPTSFLAIPIAKNWEVDISGRRSITDFIDTPTFTNCTNEVFRIARK